MATQVAFGIRDELPAYNQQPQECSREHGKVVMSVVKYPRITLGLGLAAALLVTTVTASQRQAAAMATAANAFLSGLTPEQRQQAALPFEGEERMRWNFIPNEMFPRKGLMVKSMSEAQRAQAHALLKTGLSQKGYMTATSIMDLENVLRAIDRLVWVGARGGEAAFQRPLPVSIGCSDCAFRAPIREVLQAAGIEWRSVSEITNADAQVATTAADIAVSGVYGRDRSEFAGNPRARNPACRNSRPSRSISICREMAAAKSSRIGALYPRGDHRTAPDGGLTALDGPQ